MHILYCAILSSNKTYDNFSIARHPLYFLSFFASYIILPLPTLPTAMKKSRKAESISKIKYLHRSDHEKIQ